MTVEMVFNKFIAMLNKKNREIHKLIKSIFFSRLLIFQLLIIHVELSYERSTVLDTFVSTLGPISSKSLRRVFVLKTSYEVRTLKIGFHQTIELCELLTFCRIFKTNI